MTETGNSPGNRYDRPCAVADDLASLTGSLACRAPETRFRAGGTSIVPPWDSGGTGCTP